MSATMLTTMTALNAANAANAANLATAGNAAQKAACKIIISNGVPPNPSHDAAIAFSKCVDVLYRADSSPMGLRIAIGLIILASIIGAIIGAIRDPYDRLESGMYGSLIGIISSMIGIMFLCCVLFVIGG